MDAAVVNSNNGGSSLGTVSGNSAAAAAAQAVVLLIQAAVAPALPTGPPILATAAAVTAAATVQWTYLTVQGGDTATRTVAAVAAAMVVGFNGNMTHYALDIEGERESGHGASGCCSSRGCVWRKQELWREG